MEAEAWLAFYRSDLQALYGLWVAPLLWLLHRAATGPPRGGVDPSLARFVGIWCLVFAVETLVDPWATGPLAKGLGPAGASATALLFVLLGDLRVLWLVLHVAGPERPGRAVATAAAFTAAVPLLAFVLTRGLAAAAGAALPEQSLWITHELLFLGLALGLARWAVPRRVGPGREPVERFLRAVLGFVAGYYGLWALSDALILAGVPEGWGLRAVPNQLYYGLTVPFVAWRFFAGAPSSAAR